MLLLAFMLTAAVEHPVFPSEYDSGSFGSLQGYVAESMKRSPKELYDLVPTASGIYFVGCPNCHGGSQESNVFDYDLSMGDHVRCRFCGMVFPNDTFPNNRELEITAPSGLKQVYRWHEDAEGGQHFFEAHAWWQRWAWAQSQAVYLANLYALTRDTQYGDRAAAIVGRFAQVYPDYPVRFDYPYKPKRFYPADQKPPYGDLEPYRGAKFYWWGYGDIPYRLAQAYDLIAAGPCFDNVRDLFGEDIRPKVERDLIRLGYEFASAHKDSYSNMSPGMYHDMIVAGRVIDAPEMVQEAVGRFRTLMSQKFFFDGWWSEGTPSYHAQTVGNLQRVADVARGYTTPASYSGEHFDNLDLASEVPMLDKALRVEREAVLPNGRMIPINDTWSTDKRQPTEESVSKMWPALGHAVLGAGKGDAQFQVHLNWSGGYGHSHADNASILLYGFGREMLPDIGYTHTKDRDWTINTASHNTVVVDEKSQELGSKATPTMGNIVYFDDSNPRVRYVDVDAAASYPGCGVYRRRLLHVHVDEGRDYVVDVFDAEGGKTHDWFLHGSADEEGTFESSVTFDAPVASLVPEWGGRKEPQNELDLDMTGEKMHPYQFLLNVSSAAAPKAATFAWRYENAGVRSHVFAEPDSTVYRFESPAVRGAKEVDADLPKYLSHGMFLRHAGPKSRFAAVHEAFGAEPWLQDVDYDGRSFTVRHAGGVETITLDANRATVASTAGWNYDTGSPYTGTLTGVQRTDGFAFIADKALPDVPYVRIAFGNARSIVYPVEAVKGNRLLLKNDPGFEYADGKARFLYFPQEEFAGPVTYTVYVGGN